MSCLIWASPLRQVHGHAVRRRACPWRPVAGGRHRQERCPRRAGRSPRWSAVQGDASSRGELSGACHLVDLPKGYHAPVGGQAWHDQVQTATRVALRPERDRAAPGRRDGAWPGRLVGAYPERALRQPSAQRGTRWHASADQRTQPGMARSQSRRPIRVRDEEVALTGRATALAPSPATLARQQRSSRSVASRHHRLTDHLVHHLRPALSVEGALKKAAAVHDHALTPNAP